MKHGPHIFWVTMALFMILSAVAYAAPQFVYLGQQQVSPGQWEFNYKLSNIGTPTVDIYDVEVDYEYGAAWLDVYLPGDWAMEVIQGPLARFQTTTAPCTVDTELYGFHIYAGVPYLYNGGVTFTDSSHAVVASGQTMLPIPEPGSLLALGSGLVAMAGMLLRKRS